MAISRALSSASAMSRRSWRIFLRIFLSRVNVDWADDDDAVSALSRVSALHRHRRRASLDSGVGGIVAQEVDGASDEYPLALLPACG